MRSRTDIVRTVLAILLGSTLAGRAVHVVLTGEAGLRGVAPTARPLSR